MALRIAFAGASGTGKTTLSNFLTEDYGLPFNPVGSRSVAKAMGFDSPYDVDKAGKRAEFQRRLVIEKRAWEDAHESFVVDRTTMDNLAYTMLHDVHAIDDEFLAACAAGMHRYTHIIYCPCSVFCNPGDDIARMKSPAYHQVYDVALEGLVRRYLGPNTRFGSLLIANREERRAWVRNFIGDALK
jgi:predicted ATPase